MKKETYDKIGESKHKDVYIFITTLLNDGIPLTQININDLDSSIPAVYVEPSLTKHRKYIRFSNFDSSNAINFWLKVNNKRKRY